MTIEFTTFDFGPKFDEAVTRAEHGEQVIVRRNGKEVARIVPAERADERTRPAPGTWRVPADVTHPAAGARRLGWARDLLWVSDDFEDPIAAEYLLGVIDDE